MSESTSRSDRIVAAYKRLATSAEVLNAASDEFSKPISVLDAALQRLNIGLTTWQRVVGGEHEQSNYWSRDVGYAKIGHAWGLAIRTRDGNDSADLVHDEEWLFNDAPRSYRIEAIDKLPDLIEELIKVSDKTARKLKEKAVEARELATALSQAAQELTAQRKERSQ